MGRKLINVHKDIKVGPYTEETSCINLVSFWFLLTKKQEKFEDLAVVRKTTEFFWILTPCRLVGRYQRYGIPGPD
jgi:hypothetical protein